MLVGDVIYLKDGDAVPADCLVVEATELTANESNLTGEPDDIVKKPFADQLEDDPFLLQKSVVKSGKAVALVCAVGYNT